MARKGTRKGKKESAETILEVESNATIELVTEPVHNNRSTYKIPDGIHICGCGCVHGMKNKCPMCRRDV